MTGWIALLLLLALSAPGSAQTLDVMSFNVRRPSPNDGPNVWESRRLFGRAASNETHAGEKEHRLAGLAASSAATLSTITKSPPVETS